MKFSMQQEDPETAEEPWREGTPSEALPEQGGVQSASSRKSRISEIEGPTTQERVIRRSQRIRRVTYKAEQPEFARFMRRTTTTSESRTHQDELRSRSRRTEPFVLMVRRNRTATPDVGLVSGGETGEEGGDDRTRNTESNQYGERGPGYNVMGNGKAGLESKHERASERNWQKAETKKENGQRSSKRLYVRRGSARVGGLGTMASGHGVSQKEARREVGRIKRNEIGLVELTNLSSLNHYWNSGCLQPHSLLYLETGEKPMHTQPNPFPS